MKAKLTALLLGVLFSAGCYAQNTTVAATVVDGDSVVWANASWTIDFVPGAYQSNPALYAINGAALSSSVTRQTGTLTSAGVLSVMVYDSSIVAPTGSGWRLGICPKTSGSCITYNFSTSGSSQDISTNLLTLIGQPRFSCATKCFGYSTAQATGQVVGSVFGFSSGAGNAIWNGTAWTAMGNQICHSSVAVPNTGNTSENALFVCTLPANSIGPTSRIEVKTNAQTSGAMTGTCTYRIRYGVNNASSDASIIADGGIGANVSWYMQASINERNAANTQIMYSVGWRSSAQLSAGHGSLTLSTSVNQFIGFYMTNTNAADTCTLDEADVVIWPF